MATLTKEQVDSFRENGYCLLKDQLFAPDRFKELQDIFEDHLADKGDKLSDEPNTGAPDDGREPSAPHDWRPCGATHRGVPTTCVRAR